MRLTLVTHYYPAHCGGVERVAGGLAARLAREGIAEIEWHASDCDAPPPPVPGLSCAPAPSCNVAERRLGFPYPLWTPAALQRLARASRQADIVHLHDCLYLPNLVAFAAARQAGRPVVVTQHVGQVPYRNVLLRILQSAANRLLGGWVLGKADRVVFESQVVREQFLRFVRFRSAPLLVENGVDTDSFTPASPAQRPALRASLGVPASGPLLLFLGRFVEKKGLPVLRELTAAISQAHWVLAGWGPLDPSTWERRNLTVVHSPSGEQLVRLYQAADLLVLPSVGEGFPLSVQEAMACGTPALVGTDTAAGCPAASEVLLHEVTGTGDTAARWTARLEALLAAPDVLHDMRPRVAAFARQHWAWEHCVARYADILRACAAR